MGEAVEWPMEKAIRSKTLVFGLPTAIFLIDVALTVYSQELVASISPLMHLAGGFSMGLFFLHFWEENLRLSGARSKNLKKSTM